MAPQRFSPSTASTSGLSWLAATMLLVAIALHPAPARAATTKHAAAKQQFVLGEKYYKVGDFEKAAQYYTRAYELEPFPAFLFNLGQCYRNMGNCERAIYFYGTFLREKPDAPNAPTVKALIEECRRNNDELKKAKQAVAPVTQPDSRAGGQPGVNTGAAAPLARGTASPEIITPAVVDPAGMSASLLVGGGSAAQSSPSVLDRPLFERWWFWTLVGSVVVIGAGGVAYGIVVSRDQRTVLPSGTAGMIDAR
jgi:tetratricopeptide (TPR) repeat protein